MATLTGPLATFVRNGDYPGFETEYLRSHARSTRADASASYTAMESIINNNNTKSGTGTSSFGTSGGGGDMLSQLVTAGKGSNEGLTGGLNGLMSSIGGIFSGSGNVVQNLMSTLQNFIVDGTIGYLDKTTKLIEIVNSDLGMAGELSEDFRMNIMQSWPEAERLGIKFDDLTKGVSDLVLASGKFKILDSKSIDHMVTASKFVTGGVDGFSKLAIETEKYSIGVNSTADAVTKIGTDSVKIGLNYKKVIDGVTGSLDMMYKYGLKNGIQGLADMSKKAIEFRMNMESVGLLAEKVFKPEGAIETVANLQMIGGAIGDLNDPLKLMYMATNNVEGLQDSLINATKSLATYNQEQGKFEITGANLRRVREMADATGVSYQELSKISIAAAERSSAATDLMSSGIQFTGEKAEETKEFITNLARMDNGKMVISIDSPALQKELSDKTQIALDSLTSEQAQTLFKYKEELSGMDDKDLIKQQVSSLKTIDRNISFLAAKAQLELGKTESEVLRVLGFDPKDVISGIEKTTDKIAEQIPKLGVGARNMLRGFVDFGKSVLGVEPNKPLDGVNNKTSNTDTTNTKTSTKTENNQKESNKDTKSTITVIHQVNSTVLDEYKRIWKTPPTKRGYVE